MNDTYVAVINLDAFSVEFNPEFSFLPINEA